MSVEIFNIYRKYKPNKSKNIIIQYNIIPKLTPHNEVTLTKGDTLIVHFDVEEYDVEECQKMFNYIMEAFPENNCLGLVGNTELEVIRE